MKKISFVILALSSFFAVMCGEKPSSMPVQEEGKVQIVAHRGFWNCEEGGMSENSIAALKAAQDNGFWGSEFDVQLTSDHKVLVNHDPTIDGMSIWENPASAFADHRLPNGEKVPTLDDYLEQGQKNARTMLVLEVKEQGSVENELVLTDLAIEALRAHDLLDPARVAFISFSIKVCEKIALELPGFINQYLNGDIAPDDLLERGINGIDYNQSVIKSHPEWVEQAHSLGMSTNSWTVNSEEQIDAMLAAGVRAITSNYPLRVREMTGPQESRP